MIRYACGMAAAVFLLTNASTGWSQQQYLYTPTAVMTEGKTPNKDSVLVQEVLVQKGDTLYGISRKFSGHGSYFPQILLFNEIKDPNRIYTGKVLKIPVSKDIVSGHFEQAPVRKEKSAEIVSGVAVPVKESVSAAQKQVPAALPAASVTDISPQDLKKVDSGREKKRGAKVKVAGSAKQQATGEKQPLAAASVQGQKLFENAVKAYRQDDCKTSLVLLDKFLAENKTSPLAADASLYKAECYLKLSSQN